MVVVTDSIFNIRSLHVLFMQVAGKACVCDMPGRLEGGGGGPTLMDPYRRLQRSSHRRTQVKSLPSKVPALAACCLLRKPPNLASPPARQSQKFVPPHHSVVAAPHAILVLSIWEQVFHSLPTADMHTQTSQAPVPAGHSFSAESGKGAQLLGVARQVRCPPISAEAPAAIPAVVSSPRLPTWHTVLKELGTQFFSTLKLSPCQNYCRLSSSRRVWL